MVFKKVIITQKDWIKIISTLHTLKNIWSFEDRNYYIFSFFLDIGLWKKPYDSYPLIRFFIVDEKKWLLAKIKYGI
jgi:hypothetical protein